MDKNFFKERISEVAYPHICFERGLLAGGKILSWGSKISLEIISKPTRFSLAKNQACKSYTLAQNGHIDGLNMNFKMPLLTLSYSSQQKQLNTHSFFSRF